jgi:tetratricopeptide (TPR) repeat protein
MLKTIFLTFFCFLFFLSYSYPQDKAAFNRDLDLAQTLIGAGRSSEAIEILEKLEKLSPENQQVFSLLSRAYLDNKSYPELEEHLKNWLKIYPQDWQVWTQLGDLYLKTEKKPLADESFKKALDVAPDSVEPYQTIATVYILNQEPGKAIQTYKSGIKKSGNQPLFLKSLAELYEISGDNASALEYYFYWAKEDTSKYGEVERKIMRLIESGEKPDELEKGLKKGITLLPGKSLGYKLYGDLLVKEGELSQAFELFKTADLLSGSNGENLLLFAQTCLKQHSYELSLKTSQYLENSCHRIECSAQARFISAFSLTGLGKYSEALSVYQKIARDYPIGEIQAKAYFQAGEIYLEFLNKKDEASIWYRKILPLNETTLYPASLIKLGKIYVLQDQLDSARFFFEKTLKDPNAEPVYEELNFQLAEINFYQGDFEKALESYQKLVKDFPRGLFVNNTLERLSLIKDNLGMNRPFLKDFSKALLLIYQGNLVEGRKLLDKIIQAKVPTLSDVACMEKSSLLLKNNEFKTSISEYQSLIDKYPQSLYLPLALKSIGDIYLENLKENQKAKETYELFLKKFPNSLYAPEVREKLKGLIGRN